MQQLHLPQSLIKWTKSFLAERKMGLAFDGEKEEIKSVETGIPQGSPVSPILFLIYIRFLFKRLRKEHPQLKFPSYIDDLAIVAEGRDAAGNYKQLEAAVENSL